MKKEMIKHLIFWNGGSRAYLILVTLIETGEEKVTQDLRPLAVEGFVIGAIAGAAVGATGIIRFEILATIFCWFYGMICLL